jgi:SAM-dependent methyltransferase
MSTAEQTDFDWDRAWHTAWKPDPANLWFAYQADVYASWSERCLGKVPTTARRVLKTDAFDEACGFCPLGLAFAPMRPVLMDISSVIMRDARERLGSQGAIGAVTDVRRLAFRPASLDLVFSPSTLDHFTDERDIARALREIFCALRPGGRLLVTLDNPANPVIRARQMIFRLTGPMGGVIPFPMGKTLSRARLVAFLERVGFEVLDSGYLVHTPRILGLWLAEFAARAGRPRLAGRLRAAYGRIERIARALPTRRFSAHFVAVDCRRSPAAPASIPQRQ